MTILQSLDQPPSLKEMAYRAIKNAILENRLEPGKFYNEQKLAKELAVSKTPVREALMDLSVQGFVIPLARKGFQIRVLTEKDIRDLYQFRRAIEMAVLRAITARLTEKEIAQIESIHQKEREAINGFDRARYMKIDREFHLHLVNLTGNRYMMTAAENVRDLVDWSGVVAISGRERLEEIREEHGKVIDALKLRDTEGAERRMEEHLRNSEEYVVLGHRQKNSAT